MIERQIINNLHLHTRLKLLAMGLLKVDKLHYEYHQECQEKRALASPYGTLNSCLLCIETPFVDFLGPHISSPVILSPLEFSELVG